MKQGTYKLKRRLCFGDLGVYVKLILLKRILKFMFCRCGLMLCGSEQEPIGFCVHGKEYMFSAKGG